MRWLTMKMENDITPDMSSVQLHVLADEYEQVAQMDDIELPDNLLEILEDYRDQLISVR